VRAFDSAGNAATGSVTFTVDTTAPDIGWISTPAATITSTHLVLTGRATDDTTNIKYIKWRMQEQGVWGDWQDAGATDPNQVIGDEKVEAFSIDLVDLFECEHVVEVKAIDEAGNESTVIRTTFQVDLYGPSVDDVRFSPDPTREGLTTTVTADISDTKDAISAVEFFIDGPDHGTGQGIPMTITTSTATTATATATITDGILSALSEGQHIIYVRAQDSVGNWGDVNYLQFTVDRSPIIVVINEPKSGDIYSVGDVDVSGFVVDSTTVISKIEYR